MTIYHSIHGPHINPMGGPSPTMQDGDIWRVPMTAGVSQSTEIHLWFGKAWIQLYDYQTGYNVPNLIRAMLMLQSIVIYAGGSSPAISVSLSAIQPNIGDMWIGPIGELFEFDGTVWIDRIANPNAPMPAVATAIAAAQRTLPPWLSTPFYDVYSHSSQSPSSLNLGPVQLGDIAIIPSSPSPGWASSDTCDIVYFYDGTIWIELFSNQAVQPGNMAKALLSMIAYNIHSTQTAQMLGIPTIHDLWIGDNGEFCLYDGIGWINIITMMPYVPASATSSIPPTSNKTPPYVVQTPNPPAFPPNAAGFSVGDLWHNPNTRGGTEINIWTGTMWEPVYATGVGGSLVPYLFNMSVLNSIGSQLPYVLYVTNSTPILGMKHDAWIDSTSEIWVNDGQQWIPITPGKPAIPNINLGQLANGAQMQFAPAPTPTLQIGTQIMLTINSPTHGMMVEILTDGTITYGPNYQPDIAARTFWEALAQAGALSPMMQQITQLQQQVQQLQQQANPQAQQQAQAAGGSIWGTVPVIGSGAGSSGSTGINAPSPPQNNQNPDDAWSRAMKGL